MKKGVDMTNGQPHYNYMLMDVSDSKETNMTNQDIIDRAVIVHHDIETLSKEYKALRDLVAEMGIGEHYGSAGSCVVRQNSDSETFDAKAAFEYVSEHLSPQLLSAVRKKFTKVKAGAVVVTPKAKPAKVIA